MTSRFLGTLAACLAALSLPAPAEEVTLAVGEPFPVIRLPLSGDPDDALSIERLRGRKLMLHLFASW